MFYVSDDLISLLDAGVHSEHPSVIIDSDAMFNEEVFGYSTLRGRTVTRARSGTCSDAGKLMLWCPKMHLDA